MTASPQRKPLEQIIREQDEKLTQVSGQLDALYRREANRISRGWRNIAMGITVVGLAWIYIGQPVLEAGLNKVANVNQTLKAVSESVAPDLEKDVVRGTKVGRYTVGSDFGYRIHPIHGTRKLHRGVDVGLATGTPMYAIGKPGVSEVTIECANEPSGAGIYAIIKGAEPNKPETTYLAMHLSKCDAGTYKPGQVFGLSGNTGGSTGPHLHWEKRTGTGGDTATHPPYWSLHQVLLGDFPQPVMKQPEKK